MGLFRKPRIDQAPAGVDVRFGDASVSVEWHGDLDLLVRSPHIYLDWAVNKDQKSGALAELEVVAAFVDAFPPTPPDAAFVMPNFWVQHVSTVPNPTVEVTAAFTDLMRCKVSFRPRRAIATTCTRPSGRCGMSLPCRLPKALARPSRRSWMTCRRSSTTTPPTRSAGRGGIAPLYASRVGAGRRLEAEIAEDAGLTVEQFRALPESERDEVFRRDAERKVERAERLEAEIAEAAGLTVISSEHSHNRNATRSSGAAKSRSKSKPRSLRARV